MHASFGSTVLDHLSERNVLDGRVAETTAAHILEAPIYVGQIVTTLRGCTILLETIPNLSALAQAKVVGHLEGQHVSRRLDASILFISVYPPNVGVVRVHVDFHLPDVKLLRYRVFNDLVTNFGQDLQVRVCRHVTPVENAGCIIARPEWEGHKLHSVEISNLS